MRVQSLHNPASDCGAVLLPADKTGKCLGPVVVPAGAAMYVRGEQVFADLEAMRITVTIRDDDRTAIRLRIKVYLEGAL